MPARPIRKMFQLLGLIERGRFEAACDEALEKAVDVLEHLPNGQGKAVVTMTIEISAQKEMLNVVPKLVLKLPDDKAFKGTPFWVYDGAISTQHPNQMDMLEPREVEPAAATRGR